ncbi:hypothetical protein PPW95_25230 (plasmid) [Vibrio parahaemolyticus]|uniref:hypothetical protein n=1 Tax=Vibrio harveyi group TaxID=717610 RepID=UPI000971925E|nr:MULTISPECIES: hypothetical protein [Vibrio harveyi group]APX10042.1 hypothetical protein BWP24_28040 [Vibrio campbellii]ARR10558.1 unknow [Vibrio campbellii]WCP78914.1 hypothetical protein PPW95_25230 [Vibrio parahaemolyticus]WHP52998.1 hypothetical protein QMY43_25080 [Vibrio parahaemolyticus]
MSSWQFVVPETDLNAPRMLVVGNFIAEKASGYYNGNKTSWHVTEVEWIVGDFERHQNYECNLGSKVIHQQRLEFLSVRSCGSVCFVTVRKFGDMDKRKAKKLIQEEHAKKGCVVYWTENEQKEIVRNEIGGSSCSGC